MKTTLIYKCIINENVSAEDLPKPDFHCKRQAFSLDVARYRMLCIPEAGKKSRMQRAANHSN